MIQKNIVDQNYSQAFFHFIYLFRKSIPKSIYFYLLVSLIKLFPLIEATHNINSLEDDVKGLDFFITKLYMRNLIPYNYTSYLWICLTIFIIIVLFFIYAYYIIKQLERLAKKPSFIYENKVGIGIRRKIKILTYFSIAFTTISILLNEYLFFGFFITYSIQTKISHTDKAMIQFHTMPFWEMIFLCCINGISVIIINCICLFSYYFSHYFSFNPHYGFSGSLGWIYYSLLIISDLFNGPVAILPYFDSANEASIKLGLCIFIMTISVFFLIVCYKKYLFSVMDYMINFVLLFIFISGVFEIFLCYLSTQHFTQKMSVIKVAIELFNTLSVFFIIIKYKKKAMLKEYALRLFSDSNKMKLSSQIAYINLLNNCIKNDSGFHDIAEVFLLHSQYCTILNCPCSQIQKNLLSDYSNRQKLTEYYIIVAEQEIINRLLRNSKSKRISKDDQKLLILHIDFVYSFKKSYYHALYLAHSYLYRKGNNNYYVRTKYLLYEYKMMILNTLKIMKANRMKKNFVSKESETMSISTTFYSQLRSLIYHLFYLEKLRNDLMEACQNLGKIFFFKSNEIRKLNKAFIRSEQLIAYIQAFDLNDHHLIKQLTDHYNLANKLNNLEMCYLIMNYYLLIYRVIPNEINRLIGTDLNSLPFFNIKPDEEIEFQDTKIANPMILELNNEDNFIITYISQNLCNKLHYKKSELLHEDFNILIPKIIGKSHSLYMKLFCLSGIKTLKKKTYYSDHNGNIVSVVINAKIYPSINTGLSLIIESTFKKEKNYNIAKYHFLLTTQFNILATNEPFEEYFFLNQRMIDLLKFNFCNLFALNPDKVYSHFKSYIISSRKSRQEDIIEMNRALTIMTSCRIANMFYYRRTKRLERSYSLNKSLYTFKRIINPIDLFNSINRLEKEVDDLGLDTELNYRMMFLKERIRINNDMQLQKNDHENDHIEITIKLKCINDVFYFISTVKENLYHLDKLNENHKAFQDRFKFNRNTDINNLSNTDLMQQSQSLKQRMFNQLEFTSPRMSSKYFVGNETITQSSRYNAVSPISRKVSTLKLSSSKVGGFIDVTNRTNDSTTNSQLRLVSNQSTIKMNQVKAIDSQLQKDLQSDTIAATSSIMPTQTMIQMKQARNKKREQEVKIHFLKKGLYIFNWIMVIILFIVQLIKMSLAYLFIEQAIRVFYISTYSIITVGDLSLCSLYIISNCLITDGIHPVKLFQSKSFLDHQTNQLRNHFYLVRKHSSEITSGINAQSIFLKINEELTLFHLYEDFQTKTTFSSLWEEIFYFHLLVDTYFVTKETHEECRIQEYFYKENYKTITNILNATDKEKLFYYVLHNVIPILQGKLHDVINITIEEIINYNKFVIQTLNSLTALTMALIGILYTAFLMKIFSIRKRLINQLESLTSIKPDDSTFEEDLKKFINIIKDFNLNEIKKYELQKNKTLIYPNPSIESSTISILKPNFNSLYRRKMTRKKSRNMKNNDKNNSKKNKQPAITTIDINENEEKNTRKGKRLLQPRIINLSLSITTFMLILLLVVSALSLFIIQISFDHMNLQSKIAYNIMQRIPTMIDLVIYYMITIIMNNDKYIIIKREDYSSEDITNYYNIKINSEAETIMNELDDSYYAFLYYNFQIQRGNTQNFLNSYQSKKVITNIGKIETIIKDTSSFITEIGMQNYSTFFYFEGDDKKDFGIIEIFKEVNRFTKIAKSIGNGININGLNPALDFMINEINTLYLGFFYNKDIENRNLTKYLSDIQVIFSSDNIQFMLSSVHNIYSQIIIEDLLHTYQIAKTNELSLSLVLLFTNVVFSLVILLYVFVKLDKITNLLLKVEMILKNSL